MPRAQRRSRVSACALSARAYSPIDVAQIRRIDVPGGLGAGHPIAADEVAVNLGHDRFVLSACASRLRAARLRISSPAPNVHGGARSLVVDAVFERAERAALMIDPVVLLVREAHARRAAIRRPARTSCRETA